MQMGHLSDKANHYPNFFLVNLGQMAVSKNTKRPQQKIKN